MLQRIQTVWLLLATICGAGLFYFDFYSADVSGTAGMIREHFGVRSYYPAMLVAILMVVLPLITIFLYKSRGQQKLLIWLTIMLTGGFTALVLMHIQELKKGMIINGSYGITSILPILLFAFLVLALRGIRKDERLIKSLDRLR